MKVDLARIWEDLGARSITRSIPTSQVQRIRPLNTADNPELSVKEFLDSL